MITSLCIATRGLISGGSPLSIAIDGLLSLGVSPPVPAPAYGGGGGAEPEEWKLIQETLHRESVLKDDAELVELIGAIVPFL